MRRPGSQSLFYFDPKVFNEVKVRAMYGPVKFFQTKLIQPYFFMDISLFTGTIEWNSLEQKRDLPKLFPQSPNIAFSKFSWYAKA